MSTENSAVIVGSLINGDFETSIRAYKESKIVILADDNTEKYCLDFLLTNFQELQHAEIIVLPDGEENKILEVCLQVWESMAEYKIGRKDLLINLGGGVITDMGGFIASLYKRGIDFIHVPTTLLAMVDASIGGKNGVDLGPFKNFIGLFNQPLKIFIDPIFLETLPESVLIDGMAEMFKHGLIASENHWNNLVGLKDLNEIKQIDFISDSIAIKRDIIAQDPMESGVRKLLNFGHTVGHAIEGFLLNRSKMSHGHAVGAGMIVESYLSYRKGYLPVSDYESIQKELAKWYELPKFTETELSLIIDLMGNDKKNFSNKIHFTLLKNIGNAVHDVKFEQTELLPLFREILI